MKESTKYQCEYCNTEYKDKNKCTECENNHKTRPEIESMRYASYKSDNSGYPIYLNVEFEDGEVITYRRHSIVLRKLHD